MARTYRRDSNGRFASGGGGSARPKARSAPRGLNRLTRDNAGRITSVGGEGATARGGRLRTAGGNKRATQTARIKGGGGRLRGGKGGGTSKPVGWMQSSAARALRAGNAADRSEMAKRIRSLPKAARRSIFKKTDQVQAQQNRNRASMLEGFQRNLTAKASAKKAKEQQKPKRLAFVRVYHGTSKEAAKSIRSTGYKETPRGLFGPGVYGSTSRKVAREYADWRAAGSPDMTRGKGRAKVKSNSPGGAVLAHRVPVSRLIRETGKMQEKARREIVSRGRAAAVETSSTGKRGSFAIMNASRANKTLIKQSGIVRAPRSAASRRRSVRPRRR